MRGISTQTRYSARPTLGSSPPYAIPGVVRLPRSSLLVKLWNEGRRLHGDRLRVYCENYATYDWAIAGVDWHAEVRPDDVAQYGDVLGWRPLRDRIAARDAATLRLPTMTGDHVAVTVGATQALHAILTAVRVARPRGQVLLPAPGFVGYRGVCDALGLSHEPYALTSQGLPDMRILEAEMRDRAIVVLNAPHNPTGAMPPTEMVAELARLVRRHDGLLLVDGVYDAFVYDVPIPDWGRALADANCLDSVVFVNSVSKSYGVPGLRVGWVSAPSTEWVAAIESAVEYTLVCVPTLTQRLALRMFDADTGLIAADIRRRRDLLCSLLKDVPGIQFTIPPAGTTLWARTPGRNATRLAERVLAEDGMLLLPGEGYYRGDTEALRLSFGYSDEAIRDFVGVLRRAFGAVEPYKVVPPAWRHQSEGPSLGEAVQRNGLPMTVGADADRAFSDGHERALSLVRRYVACQAVYHLARTGLWDQLAGDGAAPADVAARCGMHLDRLEGFLRYCWAEGLLDRREGRYRLTAAAAALKPYLGWFRFFVGGYGDTFRRLSDGLLAGSPPPPRDSAEVSGGSCDISAHGALPLTQVLLGMLGRVRTVLDCGCGDGLYLASLCASDPCLNGVGLEAHPESRRLAEVVVARAGMADRIRLIDGDAATVAGTYSGPPPDAVLFAFVLHEILGQRGEVAVRDTLQAVRSAYPSAALVVVETVPFDAGDPRMATGIGRGYYNPYFLTQSLTDQLLLPEADWVRIFTSAGYVSVATEYIAQRADPTRSEVGFLLRSMLQPVVRR